ncbi:MAG: ABC transporter permease [Candidatus Acidiferrales bacterium]
MMGQMVARNVIHRPVRTSVSILAVGVEVALVLIIVGLTSGLLRETGKRIEGIGADIMLQPPSASVLLTFSGAPMPMRIGDKLREIKYIQAVAPALFQFNSTGGIDLIYGIDPDSYRAVSGGFVFVDGSDMQGPDDMLVDDVAAKSRHITAGSTYRLLDHDFHVSGIVEHGKGARIFVPLTTLQDLTGARDKASVFFIKCTRADRTPAVMDQMRAIFPGYEIRPLKDFISLMTTTSLPGLDAFVRSMIGLGVAIGFLVIFLSMYTTVVERTRDIGILKALGASRVYIVKALLAETLVICAVGIVVGVGLSYATRAVLLSSFPTLSILITTSWVLRAAAIAIGGGLVGATYPAWLASRKDPVEALTYD